MEPVVVALTTKEIMLAANVGIMRQTQNIKLNRTPYHGASKTNDWQLHIEGAMGELALAKYLQVFWSGVGELRAPDIGQSIDVRTSSQPSHRLILHDSDPDDRPFFLLTGTNGTYTIQGWCLGSEGKQKQFWTDPAGGRPAFFVPTHHLHHPSKFVK